MKKLLFFLFFFLIAHQNFAQNQGISYQALILTPGGEELPGVDNSNAPLTNKRVCLRFSILDENSNIEYMETHTVTTSSHGIVNLVIGQGEQVGGYAASFGDVYWSFLPKSLKVELDVNAICTYFITISNQPFTYVPFAYYAANTDIEDATAITTGLVQLAGDLGGVGTTATAPIISNNAITTAKINNGAVTPIKIASGGNDKVLVTDNAGVVAWIDKDDFGVMADQISIEGLGTTASPFKVKDLGIVTSKIADLAVTNPKLAANAVTTDKILDGEVQTADIKDLNVTTEKLNDAAVTTTKIASGGNDKVLVTDNAGVVAWIDKDDFGVMADQISIEGLGTTASPFKVKDLGIVTNKLAAAAVTPNKIAPGANNNVLVTDFMGNVVWIDSNAFGAVADMTTIEGLGTTASPFKVKDLGIITDKLAENAVTTIKIANAAVTTTKIASGGNDKVLVTDNTGVVTWLDATAFGAVADMSTIEGAGTTASPFKVKDLGIITAKIADAAVTTAKIADLNVTTSKIADANVTNAKLADLNVTTNKLANAAVTPTKIASGGNNKVLVTDNTGVVAWIDATAFGAVADMTSIEGLGTSASPFKVKDLGIITAKLADGAVTTDKISDLNVTTDKVANSAITTVKLADANVTTTKLADAAVTTAKIASGGNNKVLVTDNAGVVAWIDGTAFGAVADMTTIEGAGTTASPFKVKDLGIITAKLADNAVTTVKIADAAVTTAKIADSNVTTTKIADANVTNAKLGADAVTTDKILDGTIVVNDLANNAVETAKIKDLNVTTTKLADAAVTTVKIASGGNNKVLVTDNAGVVAWIDGTAFGAVADQTTIEGAGTTASPFKVKDLGIITAKLADNAVTTIKITDAAVTTAKIADSNVTTTKIADANVTNAKLGADAVTTDKILDGTIVVNDLANNAVETAKIKDLNVTTNKLADAAVTTAKIASGGNNKVLVTDNTGAVAWIDGTAFGAVADMTTIEGAGTTASPFKVKDLGIITAKLADNAVTTIKIADAAVTTAKIADSNVTTTKIADANVTNAKLGADAVTTGKILDGTIVVNDLANNAVETAKIKDLNVTTNKLADAAVTTAKIASGGNNKVLVTDNTGAVAWIDGTAFGAVADMTTIEGAGTTASPFKVKDLGIITAKLADNAVTTVKIADAAVTTSKIADSNVTTTKIADANVTNAKLATDAVTTGKILDGTILVDDLANNAVETAKIKDLNVTTTKLADAAVTTAKIASGGNNKVLVTDNTGTVAWIDGTAFGAVADQTTIEGAGTTASPFKVKDLGIITAKLADNAVTTIKIADAAVTTSKIADSNVTTIKIADANVTTSKIADANVTTSKIADANVTTTKLADAAVTSAKILDGTILNEDIADNTITTDKIAGQIAVSEGGTGSDMSTTSGYVKQDGIGANFTTVTTIPVNDVIGAVRKVNGTAPNSNGEVVINWGTVYSGTLANIATVVPNPANGDTFVIANDSSTNNGRTFIYDGTTWLEVTPNQAALDARYLRLSGDTMQGDIVVPTNNKITLTDVPTNATDAANKAYVDAQITNATPDASTSVKGKIQLGGDLAGTGTTATAPVISNNAITTAKLADLNVTTNKLADAAVTTAKIASGGNNKVLVTDNAGVVAWIDGTAFGAVADQTTIEGAGTTASPFKVKDLGIITAKLADNAVTTVKIADAAVTTAKIADSNVTTTKIADANVTNAKLGADAVTTDKILDGTIVVDDLANNAVETAKIKDLNVTTTKLADAAVTTAKIASGGNNKVLVTDNTGAVAWIDGTAFGAVADQTTIEGAGTTASPFKVKDLGIITAKLADNAVTTIKIADAAVTTAKIADSNVTTTKIADANVTNAKLGADAVTTDKILDGTIVVNDLANNAVETAKIKDLNVTTTKLADAAVTTAKIASGGNNKVLVTDNAGVVAWIDGTAFGAVADQTTIEGAGTTASPFKVKDLGIITAKLADNAVTTVKIADAAVTTSKIADSNVTTSKIADANVTNAKLATDAVTTAKILDGTILVDDLAINAVETPKIKDLNVTTTKLADAAVTTAKIASGGNNKVLVTDNTGAVAWIDGTAFGAVADQTTIEGAGTTASPFKVKDLGIITAKLADNAVTTIKIADAAVTTSKIADASVATAKIIDGNITTSKLANASVTTTKIASGGNNKVLVTDNTGVVAWIDGTAFGAVADQTTIEGAGTTASPFIVKDLGIITAKLADNAVTTVKIADANVTNAKLGADAVTTDKILDGTIVVNDLANNAVETAIIKDLNVTTPKIADAAVTTAKIASGGNNKVLVTDNTGVVAWLNKSDFGGVTDLTTIEGAGTTASPFKVKDLGIITAKLADNAVTTIKIADANITTSKIADSNVTTSKIADSNVTTSKLADANVTTAKLADANVTTEKLANEAVTTAKIASGGNSKVLVTDNTGVVTWIDGASFGAVADMSTIEGAGTTTSPFKVKDLGIITAKLANDAVTSSKILNGTIVVDDLANDAVETSKIKDLNVTSDKLANDAVTTTKILNGTILNEDIADNTITTDKIAGQIAVSEGGTGSNMSTTTGYVRQATLGANFTTVTSIPVADVNGAVRKVNGSLPDSNGNVTVDFGTVSTGILANIPLVTTPGLTNGDIYVVSGDSNTLNNGLTYIFDGSQWQEVTPNQAALDARYLRLAGGTMQGDIVIPATKKITLTDAPNTATDAVNKAYVDAQIASGAPDATTSLKGKIQLGGDLAGTGTTAAAPIISDNAITTNKINADAVTTDKIQNGTIIGADLANGIITNAKLAETITVPNGGTGATSLTGYVKGNGTNAMTAVATIPVADVVGAQTTANLASDITSNTGSTTLYPSVAAVEAFVANSATPDATTTSKGKIKLAGDLAGTADLPTVPGLLTKAPIASPSFTGTPLAPTATAGTNTTQIATTEFVTTAVAAATIADASNTVKGKIQLAGDLAGSNDAANPTIAAGVVSTTKLADNAVTTVKITDANVTTAKIAADAITNAKLADNAVQTENIVDANITTAKIADANVTTAKIAAGSNNTVMVTDTNGAVTWIDRSTFGAVADQTTIEGAGTTLSPFKVKDGAITTAKLADNAVITSKINDDAITTSKITGGAITTVKLADNAVTNTKLAAASVTNAKIGEIINVANGGSGSNMTATYGYVKQATAGANFTTTTTIPVADVTGAVRTVNGSTPDSSGNVTVTFGTVYTGTFANRGTVVSSPNNGDIYVVSNDSNTLINGNTFIYDGASWQEVTANQASLDARYLKLAGGTMQGDITIPTGKKVVLTDAPSNATDATNKAYVDAQITAITVTDATSTVKGKIQLAGDLGGTAAAPLVNKLQGTAVSTTAPTTGQVLQYDGTNWKPVNATSLVKMETDEFSATAGQTSFTLTTTPIGKIAMFINGVRVPKTAIAVTGTTVSYTNSNNGGYILLVNDRVTFDYITN